MPIVIITVKQAYDDHNPALVDYIDVRVTPSIFPVQLTVYVGDVICYSAPIATLPGIYSLFVTYILLI